MNNIDDYAKWTKTTAVYKSMMYPLCGLAEEVGEVLGALAKMERGDYSLGEFHRRLKKELGDVAWMWARIIDDLGWTPSEVLQMNVDKLSSRQKNNTIKGDGDDR